MMWWLFQVEGKRIYGWGTEGEAIEYCHRLNVLQEVSGEPGRYTYHYLGQTYPMTREEGLDLEKELR